MMTLDRTRPGVASMATGIARAAFEFATEYSKERVQFGVPIAMHQAIQFMIADMATKIEAARLLTWQSAVLLDQRPAQHARVLARQALRRRLGHGDHADAVQVYGGYGFIKDYPVEKLMRDAKIMQLYEGTSQIQRLVIAREVAPSPPDPGARRREPAGPRGLDRQVRSRVVAASPLGGVRTSGTRTLTVKRTQTPRRPQPL